AEAMHSPGGIENAPQNPNASLIQLIDRILDHRQRGRVIPDDKQHCLRHLIQTQYIRRLLDRRAIYNDIVVVLGQLLNKVKQNTVQIDGITLQNRRQQIQIPRQGDDGILYRRLSLVQGVQSTAIIDVL